MVPLPAEHVVPRRLPSAQPGREDARVETDSQRHSDQLPPGGARRRHPLIAVLHAVRNTTTTQQHTTT